MNEKIKEDNIENIFGALVLAIADSLQRAAQGNMNLSAPAAAIAVLSHLPEMNINQLSHVMGLSHAGTVRLVDRLQAEGLLIRAQSDYDARFVALKLSETGETLAKKILGSRQSVLNEALASLSSDERQVLARLTEKMLTTILKSEAHAIEICRLCDPHICEACPVTNEIIRRETSQKQEQAVDA